MGSSLLDYRYKYLIAARVVYYTSFTEVVPTNCWTPLAQSGDWIGYNSGTPYGTLVPNVTSDGTFIYSYEANTVTGEFKIRFGVAGNEQLTNNQLIIYIHDTYGQVELFHDDVNLYYTGTNLELANKLLEDVGEKNCFISLAIPETLIHYDLATLATETEAVI